MECNAQRLDIECGCLPYYYPNFEHVWNTTTCNLTGKNVIHIPYTSFLMNFNISRTFCSLCLWALSQKEPQCSGAYKIATESSRNVKICQKQNLYIHLTFLINSGLQCLANTSRNIDETSCNCPNDCTNFNEK